MASHFTNDANEKQKQVPDDVSLRSTMTKTSVNDIEEKVLKEKLAAILFKLIKKAVHRKSR